MRLTCPGPGRIAGFAVAVLAVLAPAMVSPDEPPVTLPSGNPVSQTFVEDYDSSFMANTSSADDACDTLVEEGWGLVHPPDGTTPRRLEGEVVAGHTPHGDLPYNHDTEDHNIFVFPDNMNPLANDPTANYWSLLGYGNFKTGEKKEWGRIEVEWEYGAHSWNDAADSDYYGYPTWAWPNIGDRVLVEGFWTFDCGHDDYRTEIHPPWMVVTYRNTMQSEIARAQNRNGSFAALGPDDRDLSPVTRADVFISSFGGEAVDNIFDDDVFLGQQDWWQPVNSKDYDFDILAPVLPESAPPDTPLVARILEPPSDYLKPPGAVGPAFDETHLAPFTHASGRAGFHVHIPFSTVADADYMVFAKTILVGWDLPSPDVRHFRVNLQRWHVYDDLEGITESDYSAWVHSGEQNLFVQVSNGEPDEDEAPEYSCDSDINYAPQCDIDNNTNNYAKGTFGRFLGPADPLVISFRAKELDVVINDPLQENDDAGFADQSFTAAEEWGVGSHQIYQSDQTWSGEHNDSLKERQLIGGIYIPYEEDDPCDGPDGTCYRVTYDIERILDPTTTTIGQTATQYAQDPNHFTATVVTPGTPDKPRRRLPVTVSLSGPGGAQSFTGVTGDDGLALPDAFITLPGGTYQDMSSFAGNGLLAESSAVQTVTIARDVTASALEVADELRWGHHDPLTVTLIEPNVGQDEPELPVVGKPMVVTLTGPLGEETYTAGPTGDDGTAVITPLMALPPGNYEATACFAEDPWFLGSCSTPQPVKVTAGFAAFARSGPIVFGGTSTTTRGDVHGEGSVDLGGNAHHLSAEAGERLEYVTTFDDHSVGSVYNVFKVAALGMSPQYLSSTYCGAGNEVMGVPVTFIPGHHTFKNGAVLSGIYCVGGNARLQSGVSGQATIVAGGTISTAGGGQNLTTADPTGADVLLFAGSSEAGAVDLFPPSPTHFTGTIVAVGGVTVRADQVTVTGALIGTTVSVSGSEHLLDGRH